MDKRSVYIESFKREVKILFPGYDEALESDTETCPSWADAADFYDNDDEEYNGDGSVELRAIEDAKARIGDIRVSNLLSMYRRDNKRLYIIEVSPGVYLQDGADASDGRRYFSEEEIETCKDVNFSSHDFWITTNDGVAPIPYDNIRDAVFCL